MPPNLNLKKSWHPGLLKNQKKLWEQEQDALQEHHRIKEREKERDVEREKQRLLELQYGEHIPADKRRELSNLNWMYEEAPKEPKETTMDGFRVSNDDFTEGKKQVEDMLSGKHAIETKVVSRMERTMGGVASNGHNSYKDDPLLKIKDQEIRRLREGRERAKSREREHSIKRQERGDRDGREARHHKHRKGSRHRVDKPLDRKATREPSRPTLVNY